LPPSAAALKAALTDGAPDLREEYRKAPDDRAAAPRPAGRHLLLTLSTLGLYSPWAKVRKAKSTPGAVAAARPQIMLVEDREHRPAHPPGRSTRSSIGLAGASAGGAAACC